MAVAVVLFAVYALVLGRGAAWLDGSTLRGLTASQRASEIDTMRGYLIQIGAGVLAAGALLYTALNFQLAREGHVTDRYTKAIEQLGSERLDVRLGAIYAMERIMIDSIRDHPTIVEVLAAFVREHSPQTASGADPDRNSQTKRRPWPDTDTQAALTVLGRRPAGRIERGPVNLTGAYMVGANLRGATLTGTDLSNAALTNADLSNADLRGAHLTNVALGIADMSNADLRGADLRHANLIGTNLTRANLTGADLTNANLTSANLTHADLTEANLTEANLTGRASLIGVILIGADLTDANMTGVTLSDKQRSYVRGLPAVGS